MNDTSIVLGKLFFNQMRYRYSLEVPCREASNVYPEQFECKHGGGGRGGAVSAADFGSGGPGFNPTRRGVQFVTEQGSIHCTEPFIITHSLSQYK